MGNMMQDEPVLTQAAELTGAFIGKRLNDNLEFFKENVPDVYNEFKDYQESQFFLIYGSDGEINLFDREAGELVYGDNPVGSLLENLENYKENPISRSYHTGGGDPDFEFIIPVHYEAVNELGKIQREAFAGLLSQKIVNELSASGVDGTTSISAGHLPKYINSFFVFSVGLGFDIEKLYQESEIKRLFIVENNKDSFYASMQLIDWAEMSKKAVENGYKIYFFIADDPDELLADLTAFIGQDGRHNVAGGYLYSSFFREGHEEIYKGFKDKLDLSVFSGFGFYDDSRMSVAHTLLNFKNDVPCIKSDKNINKAFGQKDWPVFVVGSGPSLDSDIEFIKNNQDNAFVISCGSSLKALYVNGIVPDFHVELERTAHVLHWIKNTSEDSDFLEYLKNIRFVGMSQVHPDVFSLFKSSGQIPKDTETGSFIAHKVLGGGVPLVSNTAPTCVHSGLTLAVLFGFENIYLFGVDMGYKSYDSHHSKYSLYDELSEESAEKLVPSNKGEQEVEANFEGEIVYASGYFPMFRYALEKIVKNWLSVFGGRLQIYNCSDGAKIAGAQPVRSADVVIADNNIKEKELLAEQLFSSYFAFSPSAGDQERLDEFLTSSFDKVDAMCAWLGEQAKEVNTVPEAWRVVDQLSYGFHSEIDSIGLDEDDSWLYSLFDGTLLYALSAIQSTLALPVEDSVRVESFNRMMGVMKELFHNISHDYRYNSLVADKEEYYDFFS